MVQPSFDGQVASVTKPSSEAGTNVSAPPAPDAGPLPTAPAKVAWMRRWGLAWLIPVCAVAPWVVPWPWQQQPIEQPTSDPSSIIALAHSQAVTGRAPTARPLPPPSEASVRALVRDLVATARYGYDMPVSPAEVAKVKTTPGPYERLGRVAIPKIKLNVAFGEGVYAKALDHGPGHWPGTPMPGETGNAVLSGHRNTHTAPFKYLNLLRPGNPIVLTTKNHKAVTYRVVNTKIVKEAQFKDYVVRQPQDPAVRMVTLFACHPEGNPVYRIVVRATA